MTVRFRGLTILEIVVATLMFLLAAIPLYRALSAGAAKEVDSTKLSMARKILESMRAEVVAKPFKDVSDPLGGSTTLVDLPGGLFTNTVGEVLNVQKTYKDFEMTVKARFATPGSVIEVKGSVVWTSTNGKPHAPEELTFLIIKP
ncbi:MAG: hypothetical protein GX442_02935 [Candidatus Riflebacteria bacterium]|nr:hypothetical protein [Candidatus Riflebacteria bacterium]